MFDSVIVVLERASRVVGWIDVYAFDLARIILFQGLERQQVVAVDQQVFGILGAVALGCIFKEYAGFQAGLLVFADPGEFEFGF